MNVRVDSEDYVTNSERSHPKEIPDKLYVVSYIKDGEIIWTFPSFYEENILKRSALMSQNHDIIEYTLTSIKPVTKKLKLRKIRRTK